MSWFEISPYFTLRWVDNNLVSPYNTVPLQSEQDTIGYLQPVQCGGGGYQSDTGQIQLTSDFVPTGGLYDFWTNVLIKTITFTPITPPIIGNIPGTTTPITFICYNAEIDFSDVDPGLYYAKINYTDDDEVVHDWRTNPLNVQVFHDGTQLCEATNFTNDKGIVFVNADLTTLVIKHRVASLIRAPLPKSDSTDYEDQFNELTQEQSVPFVIYTQLLGGPALLPFYEIEKINLLYSLDLVLWDGQPFTKVSGADFKPTRSDTGKQQGAFWEVDIQPNFSYPSEQFITGTPTDGGDYIVIKQQKTFLAQSADFAFTGNFNIGKNLIRLAVKNTGLDVFTLKVGNASGDNSFGEFDIPADLDNSLDIGKYFTGPEDVWISGIAGTNLDVTFDWNDYRAVNTIPLPTGTGWKKNTLYYFDEIVPGSFAVEFDVATGLGNVGTDHEGCVLSGTNGTPARAGLLVQIWDSAEVLPANTRGTIVGAVDNSITLANGQIPTHVHNTVNGDIRSSGGADLGPGASTIYELNAPSFSRSYLLQGSSTQPDRGTSSSWPGAPGDPTDPIDITNRAVILPAFYYIGV